MFFELLELLVDYSLGSFLVLFVSFAFPNAVELRAGRLSPVMGICGERSRPSVGVWFHCYGLFCLCALETTCLNNKAC
jgi:hypothetical protein